MVSINKIITVPYKHSGKLKTQVKSGFATVSQKSTLVKLEVLFDAQVLVGDSVQKVNKGQFVYLSEEILHSAVWAKQIMTTEGFNSEFIVIDPVYVIGVE